MKTDLEYTLKISEEHGQILWDALELYCRIHMGQWDSCVEYSQVPMGLNIECRKELERVADQFQATPGLCGFYSILSEKLPIDAKIAFDMKQVIRHRLSHDRNPKARILMGVHFDKPSHWVSDRPLLTIKKENNDTQ